MDLGRDAGCAISKKETQIPTQLARMNDGLDKLEKEIHLLEKILEGILRPGCPQPTCETTKPEQTLVVVAEVIKQQSNRVFSLRDKIQDITNRIEL